MDTKPAANHCETALENDADLKDIKDLQDADLIKAGLVLSDKSFTGDVNLTPDDGTTYLIPAPSQDPRGEYCDG